MSIRDVDQRGTAAGPESKHQIVWAGTYPEFKGYGASPFWTMSDTASIHLTRVYSHKAETKCTISGELEQSSLVYLQKLFTETLAAAIDVNESIGQLSNDLNAFHTRSSVAPARRHEPRGDYDRPSPAPATLDYGNPPKSMYGGLTTSRHGPSRLLDVHYAGR